MESTKENEKTMEQHYEELLSEMLNDPLAAITSAISGLVKTIELPDGREAQVQLHITTSRIDFIDEEE